MSYEVREYDCSMYSNVVDFLSTVNTLKRIEDAVIENAVVVTDGKEKICGMVSYETFRKNGLIRYFIFESDLNESVLSQMFVKLYKKAKEQDLNQIYSIISSDDVKELFVDLGFVEVEKRIFYINERNINNTKYHEATVMSYKLENVS